jgi:CRP-like cAMP-binding protein
MFVRYRLMAANDAISIPFAFTQAELGDAQGMSTVHVNRTLRMLRMEGLFTISERVLTIHDWPRLQEAGHFDESYLHLGDADPAAA